MLECVLNSLLGYSNLGSYKINVQQDTTTVVLRFDPKSAVLCVEPTVQPVSSVKNVPFMNKRQKTPSRQRRDERRWNQYRNRTVWSSTYRKSECSVPGTRYDDISSVGRTTTSTTHGSAIASSYTPNVADAAIDDSDGIVIEESKADDGPTHPATPINDRGVDTQSVVDDLNLPSTSISMCTHLFTDNESVKDNTDAPRVTATTKNHRKRYGKRKRVASTHSDSDGSTSDDILLCGYTHDDGPDNNDGFHSTKDDPFNHSAPPCPADDDTNSSTNQHDLQLDGHDIENSCSSEVARFVDSFMERRKDDLIKCMKEVAEMTKKKLHK